MFDRIHQLKEKEAGFTLIELLIVIVIIGVLAAVAVPLYSQYITISRASEAVQVMTALIEYCHSYEGAKGDGNFPSDANWVAPFVPPAADNPAFNYTYDGASLITAAGNGTTAGIAASDTLSYNMATDTWAASTGIMDGVRPTNDGE